MSRRRENIVAACLFCGAVLGIFVEGEMPKLEAHDCAVGPWDGDWLDAEDMRAELRATRNPDRA